MRNLISIFVISFLFSCETVVQIELPDEPERIVVNALAAADSTWLFRITASKGPLEEENYLNTFKPIKNAQVTLKDAEGNDHKIAYKDATPDYIDCEFDNCDEFAVYTSTSKTVENKVYTLEVSANGFPGVKSRFQVPRRVMIDAVEFGEPNLVSSEYYSYSEVNGSIFFQDPPNEKNYYLMEVYAQLKQYLYQYDESTRETIIVDSSYYYNAIYLTSPDPSIINIGVDDIDDHLLINDNLIDGNEVKLNFTAEINAGFDINGRKIAPEKLVVFLKHISEDYYNYLLTYENYLYASGNPFAEPVQIASNIQNGLGMIAAYASDTVVYELER